MECGTIRDFTINFAAQTVRAKTGYVCGLKNRLCVWVHTCLNPLQSSTSLIRPSWCWSQCEGPSLAFVMTFTATLRPLKEPS